MRGVNLFDTASAARIGSYVNRREAFRQWSPEVRGRSARKTELAAFRVVSDLSQEAIDGGNAEHGTEITADFMADSQVEFADLGDGCQNAAVAPCTIIPSCFPCDISVTIVDSEFYGEDSGTVWTFAWSGTFNISVIDGCNWLYETRYVPMSANAAGVVLILTDMLLGTFHCARMRICDSQFSSEPGYGSAESLHSLAADAACPTVEFRNNGVNGINPWPSALGSVIYRAEWSCTDEVIANGHAILESFLPQCVIDSIVASQAPDVGEFTVDLSLFGGVPEPGSILHAKNLGGRWYGVVLWNLRVIGRKRPETDPFRIDVDGCNLHPVPFVYLNQTYGLTVTSGSLHFLTWCRATRQYIASRWVDC